MNFNAEQSKAITLRGKDVFVSASAGSGKTAVMIERVARLIESGEKLERMLIVTFTKAAAAEMKSRLLARLGETCDNPFCRDAVSVLPLADISTLHSFCVRLAKTYFYAIDVDPAFELLGESGDVLLDKCVDAVAENFDSEQREKLYNIMLVRRRDDMFKTAVKKLYSTAVATVDPIAWLDGCLDLYRDDTQAKHIIADMLENERKILFTAARDLSSRTAQAKFERNAAVAESLANALQNNDASLILPSPRGRVNPAYIELNAEYAEMKKRAAAFFEKSDEMRRLQPSLDAYPFACVLKDAAKELYELYAAEKKKNCVIDYNDLEHYAYAVLGSSCGKEIREAYDWIFVDEYQDINPLQNAIIERIKRGGNLFTVGDLKQSIYAFRGCDPSIFSEKKKRFETSGEGESIELNSNYRTLPEVIEKVNTVFGKVMTASFGGVDYEKHARLVPFAQSGGKFRYVNIKTDRLCKPTPYGSVYAVSEHEDEDVYAKENAESDFIVGEIIKLLTYGDDESHEVAPSDIAVLTRSRTALSYAVRDKLKRHNIPAFVKESDSFGHRPETAPLIAMLKLVDNAADDIALTSALKSYCGGFKNNDFLASVALTCGKDEPFYAAAARNKELEPFFSRLERYTELKQSVSAGELLNIIARESNAFVYVRKMPGGEDNVRNLGAFLRSTGEDTVEEYLEKLRSSAAAEISAPDGCVKIMTVHMSKGLEFPYVFFAEASHKFNVGDFRTKYIIDRDKGFAFKYPDELTHEFKPTFLYEALKTEGMHRALEEELRVLYVALTRAKKELVISGCDIPDVGTATARLPSRPSDFLTALTAETVLCEPIKQAEPAAKKVPSLSGGDLEAAQRISRRIESTKRVFQSKRIKAKTSVTAAARELWADDGYYRGSDFLPDTDTDAAERGTAYHLFMQHVDFYSDFEEQADRFSRKYETEAKLIDFEKARRAVRVVGELMRGKKLYREKEFILNENGTLMQGVIDIFGVSGGKVWIVDYKTGACTDSPAYVTQLELYAEAVNKLLGLEVTAKYIYSIDSGALTEIRKKSDYLQKRK